MDEISVNMYMPLCEQYNSLAQNFYQQYLIQRNEAIRVGKSFDFFENPEAAILQSKRNIIILQLAICSVVFECFAIESYVNFWGAYRLGDDAYYSKYETKPRYSTIEKIKLLCKDEFNSPYPTGGKHFATLKRLFTKRGQLAHDKPKGHMISNLNGNTFDDYNEAISALSFVASGIDEELQLYQTVKENLSIASKLPDPVVELQERAGNAIEASIEQMINPWFGNHNT